jgi:hypothetical protein
MSTELGECQPKPKHPKQISPTLSQAQHSTSGGMKQQQVGTANPQANLTNPHMPNALATQQMSGGMKQQQPHVPNPQANPMQVQQPPHKQLTPQQMRLQRRNSGLLRRNTSF